MSSESRSGRWLTSPETTQGPKKEEKMQQVKYTDVVIGTDGEIKVLLRFTPDDAEEVLILSLTPLFARSLSRDLRDRVTEIVEKDED